MGDSKVVLNVLPKLRPLVSKELCEIQTEEKRKGAGSIYIWFSIVLAGLNARRVLHGA